MRGSASSSCWSPNLVKYSSSAKAAALGKGWPSADDNQCCERRPWGRQLGLGMQPAHSFPSRTPRVVVLFLFLVRSRTVRDHVSKEKKWTVPKERHSIKFGLKYQLSTHC